MQFFTVINKLVENLVPGAGKLCVCSYMECVATEKGTEADVIGQNLLAFLRGNGKKNFLALLRRTTDRLFVRWQQRRKTLHTLTHTAVCVCVRVPWKVRNFLLLLQLCVIFCFF